MAKVEVILDGEKVERAIADAPKMRPILQAVVAGMAANANALSAGYRTGRFYDRAEKKLKGDTQPRYASNVERHGKALVGLVYTANYAAMKENHEHNTLLKTMK